MNEREQEFLNELKKIFVSFTGQHCSQSIRQMNSALTIEEYSKIWKKYFLESFTKIFTTSEFIKKYQDIIEQYGILYNKDNEEGLTYNYCDTDKIDFEKHGLVFLRNANDCRIYDYAVFEAENCKNLKIFSNVKGKISGEQSSIIATHRCRFEADNIDIVETKDEVYGIVKNCNHVIARNNSVINIYAADKPVIIDAYDNSIIIGVNYENVTVNKHSDNVTEIKH